MLCCVLFICATLCLSGCIDGGLDCLYRTVLCVIWNVVITILQICIVGPLVLVIMQISCVV